MLVTRPHGLHLYLMAFPAIALTQMEEGRGLKRLSFEAYQNIAIALDQMNSLTDQQAALIKLTMQGKRYQAPLQVRTREVAQLVQGKAQT
ncbi:hypothetical protein [uncultured Nostoc sp.]|uniref:hypothetical protein n=1 Tax=uncultured Nostoc sp. TaxID=340711 RepID=UPI0035C9BE71